MTLTQLKMEEDSLPVILNYLTSLIAVSLIIKLLTLVTTVLKMEMEEVSFTTVVFHMNAML